MAARRTSTKSGGEIVIVNSAPPARRRSSSIRRRSSGGGRKRRRSSRGGGSHGIGTRIQRAAMGGLAYGLAVKNFPNLPRIPGIGRSGTVALAVYFMKPTSQLLQDVGIAAAAIAGASFGEAGTVSGDDDDDILTD